MTPDIDEYSEDLMTDVSKVTFVAHCACATKQY